MDYEFTKIKTIEVIESDNEEYVYDLVIEDPTYPYFFGNDILVHNSCHYLSGTSTLEEAIKLGNIIERQVNASFPKFATDVLFCTDEFNTLIKAELDFIAGRGIYIKKKMYILNLLHSEGSPVDKMKVMGVQLKKTTIPKPISKTLIEFLEEFLKGGDWKAIAKRIVIFKDILIEQHLGTIGLPKGIKGIEDYTARYNADEPNLKLPGHVAAAMFYNKCLDTYGDKSSTKIVSGMKIKTYYLIKKFGKFKSIALPTDMKVPPDWFMKHFAPLIDRQAQLDRLVNKPLQSILTAIGENAPTTKTILIDDLFGY